MADQKKPVILMAEDDYDDRILNRDALREAGLDGEIRYVTDGVELMDYLYHKAPYQDAGQSPRPDLILLDLKMPRKNGWEALEEIRADPQFRELPVFILTTSSDEDDRQRAIRYGADGFYTKPVTFDGLVVVMKSIEQAWKQTPNSP